MPSKCVCPLHVDCRKDGDSVWERSGQYHKVCFDCWCHLHVSICNPVFWDNGRCLTAEYAHDRVLRGLTA